MRTKIIIEGLRNTQKFRAIINGVVIGDCQVKDILGSRFGQREQRIAVCDALMQIALRKRHGHTITSFGTNRDGVYVQVDLV